MKFLAYKHTLLDLQKALTIDICCVKGIDNPEIFHPVILVRFETYLMHCEGEPIGITFPNAEIVYQKDMIAKSRLYDFLFDMYDGLISFEQLYEDQNL